ncbi:asparagine synthase (glutamine-hydrolyzing) [Adhaeribacter pallidiroseus]|uniref:asparagine synthase (glutamine-hydrolyzing) n=1 Tax=Adhaeribacter pallidiroseus TaxID=2072847 RepID=A0A369QBG1_9BACT|nr:asparagine synthase (glutamine-hydrolyzing) [Adhaeribacter pallidiroseus]RDC61670.1 Asparagine synthase (glutamine-hydrolyzing) [Adhaeribacter pallidiroseus]
MCGINLIISKKGKAPDSAIIALTEANKHRGPDATVYFTDTYQNGQIYFGHNRLKIIDLSPAANQPFFSADERFLLLYNGEIYNYLALRQELQTQGYAFRTNSDTEVLLAVLITYGQAGIEKLNGMFAFVFYDTQTQQLLAARDRFGIKRLYYVHTPDYLLLSSEINSLLASGLVKKELNESQLLAYLRYRHALKPETFYRDIMELEEGQVLTYANHTLHLASYLTPPAPNLIIYSEAEIIQKTESLLLQSVERHLQADVPVGLFLSGGIDSTLILALAQQLGYAHFPAFTVSNKASESTFGSEDYWFSRVAAQQFGAEHLSFEINASILHYLDELVATLDQPIADGAALLTYYLSEQVKGKIKVALSGAGADELYGGYNRHRAFYHFLQHRSLARMALPLLQASAPLLATGIKHPLRKQFLLLRKLAYKIKPQHPEQTFLNFTSMDRHLQQLLQPQFQVLQTPAEQSNMSTELLRWGLDRDLHQYLIADILAMTDKTSMAHSLEVRTPYLDNHLHQFTQSLPAEVLFKNGSKWILKRILEQHHGQQLTHRAKEGFGMPLGQWLKETANQWLFADLQNPQHLIFKFLKFPETQILIQALRQGRHDYSTELWALIVLARWLNKRFTD